MKNILNTMCKIYREVSFSNDVLFVSQDVIEPVYLWPSLGPSYIKKILTSSTFNYPERIKLTTFFFVNGYRDPLAWLQLIVKIKGSSFRKYESEIISLFKYFEQEQIKLKYFSYCMSCKRYEYLNGSPREAINPKTYDL